MKKASGFLLAILLFSLSIPLHVSAAAPIAGANCSKAGLISPATTKKFTCIKSGKKLVWNQGVLITKVKTLTPPTTTVSSSGTAIAIAPTATPSPTPTVATVTFKAKIPITLPVPLDGSITFANATSNISQIPQVAWQRVQDTIAANPEVSVPINITIGPTTKTTEEPIVNAIKREYRLFAGFSVPTTYSGVVFGPSDEKWAETKAIEVLTSLGYISNTNHDQAVLSQVRGACNFDNGVANECYGGNAVPVFVKKD